ncbi:MAG TPA: hypothetical protein VHE30_15865 [Polyangiaceae bacterium]|nr:hypothetical protein [Polyangiaceae bacterium]
MKRFLVPGTLALALSLASGADASPLFELVGGTFGTAGYNGRVTGAGAASTYYNPALLGFSEQEFDVGVLTLSDQISMTLDGRPGGDVPLVVGDRTALDPRTRAPIPNDTAPTQWLQKGCKPAECNGFTLAPRPRQGSSASGTTRQYATIGLVSRVLDQYLVLGLHAIVPVADFTELDSFYNDQREQFFSNSLRPELYSDRLTATSLAFGAGSRITKMLSVGMSFTLSLTNAAHTATYVRDPADYKKLLLDNDVTVTTTVAPHFGVVFAPLERLRISGTFHTVQKLELETGIVATLPNAAESNATFKEVHDYVPWIAAIGADFDLNPGSAHAVSIAWTTAYEAWSGYVDRHGERPEAAGEAFAWKDVITVSAGARYKHGPVRTYLDVTYHPSPVPLQTGRTNYVDNDRAGLTLGGEYEVKVLNHRLRFGVGAQAQRLFPRYQAKNDALIVDEFPDGSVDRDLKPIPGSRGLQTNNPGWPGFASEGWILGGHLYASLVY